MTLLRAFRAMGAAFMLVLVGVVAHATLSIPAVNGPFLGDSNTNLFTIATAINNNNQMAFTPTATAGAAATQSTCFAITNPLSNITTGASNGSICLPTATAGRELFIANSTGQTLNIFGSNTPFTIGTQDTINGTTGSTSYSSLTSGKNAQCFTPANGAWFCASGS